MKTRTLKTHVRVFLWVALAASVGLPVAGQAGGRVLNIQTPTFPPDASVTGAIKRECQLPQKLSKFIKQYADGFDTINTGVEPSAKGWNLSIQIVHATAGGGWGGAKTLNIKGKLYDGKKLIGSFRGQRTTTGGAWGGYKGTCSKLGRDAKALGRDIAQWLQEPTMNAGIGELR